MREGACSRSGNRRADAASGALAKSRASSLPRREYSIRRWTDRRCRAHWFYCRCPADRSLALLVSSYALRAEADGRRAGSRAPCRSELVREGGVPDSPHHLITAARQQVVSYRGAPRQCHPWRVGVLILAEGRGSWLADDGVRSGPEIFNTGDGRTDTPRAPVLLPVPGRSQPRAARQLLRPPGRSGWRLRAECGCRAPCRSELVREGGVPDSPHHLITSSPRLANKLSPTEVRRVSVIFGGWAS
jgi:hypothetical protein